MSSKSFAIRKSATAKLKKKRPPAGFPVALCNTAIQSCDRHSNRKLLLLRVADFVVDAVDDVNVSLSEFVLSPPCEHLAFSGIDLMHRQNLVAVEEVSGTHQHRGSVTVHPLAKHTSENAFCGREGGTSQHLVLMPTFIDPLPQITHQHSTATQLDIKGIPAKYWSHPKVCVKT